MPAVSIASERPTLPLSERDATVRRCDHRTARRWRADLGRAFLLTSLIAGVDGVGCRAPAESVPPPNVVIVLVDALRADHLSLYGYSRPTSPHLDRLAGESVVFEQARA